MTYLWVAFGSACGGVARFWLGGLVARLLGTNFPWGTLLINVSGSFVIGLFGAVTGAAGRLTVDSDIRVFVMVGLCGGFTTFSSFSLQTLELLQGGDTVRAAAYVVLSVLLCLCFVWLGAVAVRL